MKKVLIIRTNKVDPDPRVEKEANALCMSNRFDVEVLAWNRSEKHICRKEMLRLTSKDIPIYRFGILAQWGNGMKSNIFPAIKYELKCFFWLLFNIRRYDCIHACDLMTGLPALIPAKLFRKKFVYDCCDYYADSQHGPEKIMMMLRKLENYIIGKADATILCSEERVMQISPAQPKKICYIHNSPDVSSLKVKQTEGRICRSNSKRLKLVYVGNYCADRWIIELLKNVAKMQKTVEIHIGGFGALDNQIKNLAELNNNIFVYGKLSYNEVLQLESECDIVTALYETHLRNHIFAAPNKFYEALALGKPLLMFKGSGMSEIVELHGIGAVISPTFESLKQGLEEITVLLKHSNEISKKMKDLFENYYNWSIMEKRLIDLYNTVLEKR